MSTTEGSPKRIPIREDFFEGSLDSPETIRLRGTRCRVCMEVFLGQREACENCQGKDLESILLSRRGKLWSYTVNRYRPPGDYVGPDPYVPFAVGWVELPEGLRILSPLTECDIEDLTVGADLELVVVPLYLDAEGNQVFSYKFRPI